MNDIGKMIIRNTIKDMFDADKALQKQVFESIIDSNWHKIEGCINDIQINIKGLENFNLDKNEVKALFN